MPTITISVSDKMKDYVTGIIEDGTYSNVSEVFRDGLRSVQEKQLKLQALREHVSMALEKGGSHTAEQVSEELDTHLDSLNIGE